MAIQLIPFRKSDDPSDDDLPKLTFRSGPLGSAAGVLFVLLIGAVTSALWGPWYSSLVVDAAGRLSDPGRRDFAYGIAWYARNSDTLFVLLMITNAVACAGYLISSIRIHEVVTDHFSSRWAHLDGGTLDWIARVACVFGGWYGGACGLLMITSRYGYAYRYSRCATVILSIVLNILAFWFLTGIIGACVSRPNYDPMQQTVRPSLRERIDVNYYMGMYLTGRSPFKVSDHPELAHEIDALAADELEELKQTEEQLVSEFNAQDPFFQYIMKESSVSSNPVIAHRLGDLELKQMDDVFRRQAEHERFYEAGGGYFGYEQRHSAKNKEHADDNAN